MTEGRPPVAPDASRRELTLDAAAAHEPSPGAAAPRSGSDTTLATALDGAAGAVDVLRTVDPDGIHPDDLGDAVRRLRRVRNRLEAVETGWLAAMQRRRAHEADGATSTATWARDQLGSSWRDAKGQLHTADELQERPAVKDAFDDGQIGRDAASEVVKALGDDKLAAVDDAEDQLLDAAVKGGPDLVRKLARKLRTHFVDHDQAARDADEAYRRRYADVHTRDDGTVKIDALLDQVNGEHFLAAWRPLLRDMHNPGPSGRGDLDKRTRRQKAADAFGELGRRALADDGTVPQIAGRPSRVIVTTDLGTLRKAADAEADGQLLHTGPISAETARRLSCEANIVPVVLDGASVPVDLGRTSREPSIGQRDCLIARDRSCRGCGAPAHLCQPHHATHWANGGSTDLANLVLLCHHCHQLVHEGRWNVTWNPDNSVTFTSPTGRRIQRPPPT